jgi:5-methylcytosine-specific restriction endonuclease McrA
MPFKSLAARRRYARDWMRRRRESWLAANGPCRQCGATADLEVDHIDPAQKVSHAVWSWSAARREAELAKCQVLCSTCHKKKTAAARPIAGCGTRSRYVAGCRCDCCREANRRYSAGLPGWKAVAS